MLSSSLSALRVSGLLLSLVIFTLFFRVLILLAARCLTCTSVDSHSVGQSILVRPSVSLHFLLLLFPALAFASQTAAVVDPVLSVLSDVVYVVIHTIHALILTKRRKVKSWLKRLTPRLFQQNLGSHIQINLHTLNLSVLYVTSYSTCISNNVTFSPP